MSSSRSPSSVLCRSMFLFFLTLGSSCSLATGYATRQEHQGFEHHDHRVTTSDPNNAYALYSLPPFTVTFTSSYSTTGLPQDEEEQGQLLVATLHGPLQLITSEFLVESFRLQIYHIQEPTRNTTTPHDKELQNILESFMTLDVQVAVRALHHLSLNGPQVRRHLADSAEPRSYYRNPDSNTNDGGNANSHTFHQEDTSTSTSSSSSNTPPLLQFEADFFTTAAFLEPTPEQAGASKPTDQEVVDLLGGWMNSAFAKDLNYYHDSLVNSETGVLMHVEQLHVETDSGAIYDPYTSGAIPNAPLAATQAPIRKQDVPPPPNAAAYSNSIGAWSHSEKLFFTLLVMVSILSIAGLLMALHKYKGRGRYLNDMMAANDRSLDHDFMDPRICISGRHSDEILDILNASDRYLAAHRPDLLEAMQHADARRRGGNNAIVPIPANDNEQQNSNGPTERRYVTVANPFSHLYGASYFHSEKTAVEADRARRVNQDPMDAVELQQDNKDAEEEIDTDQSVSKYLQTWFQQLVGTRTVDTEVYKNNDDYYDDEDDEMEELDLNAASDDDQIMACDEDPKEYAFPFQDFPRQDGTPCLIYEETLNEEEEEQYLKNSRADSLHSTTSYGIHDPLTDDEFQRALGAHMVPFTSSSTNTSFEHHAANTSDSSLVRIEDGDNEIQVHDLRTVSTDDDDSDPSKFTNKLEKMVAMRHRHYEKQKIMDKHREQRKQERARQRAVEKKKQQEEMQQRDLKLRRHSLELDIQELEAAVGNNNSGLPGPPTSASKVITPPGGQGGLHQLQRPSLHRRTSSEADAGFLGPDGSVTASGAVIHSNRSMDLGDTGMSTKSDSHRINRVVQSAQKAPRPVANNRNDVFRSMDRISPLSSNSATSTSGGSGLPPTSVTNTTNVEDEIPIVSPASSMTETGTDSTPSSAGFQKRRSMSFGGVEEKKVDDEAFHSSSPTGSVASNRGRQMLPPQHQQRTHSANRHRRSNSSSPADVMVHGIYAQFV
ncbi:expressed unknown protein [Seminavis robusta]|uniref:Uncharacterized protein n=1 Tax=Seminavis robusta TaxID=568900 RepID=A0A9N8HRQ1_9STRA|nr:expressed unknown protein [Seminavis robusta]|eukprot:Sro1604_g285360.1 n/a (1000) ;mRNA; f:8301-11413